MFYTSHYIEDDILEKDYVEIISSNEPIQIFNDLAELLINNYNFKEQDLYVSGDYLVELLILKSAWNKIDLGSQEAIKTNCYYFLEGAEKAERYAEDYAKYHNDFDGM